jgi:hypothetical protein
MPKWASSQDQNGSNSKVATIAAGNPATKTPAEISTHRAVGCISLRPLLSYRQFQMLRQIVRNVMPWRLAAHEDVHGRLYPRISISPQFLMENPGQHEGRASEGE